MKKLFRLLLVPVLAVGLITSCSTDHQNDLGYGKDHKLNAQFTAGIASSRVTGNNWDKEDVIGIYAVNSGQELAADAIYKGNSKYTTVSESGTGDFSPASDNDAIIFEKEGNKLDFIAYYPYQATVTDYKLAIDVSDQSKLSKIDYLYSNNAKGHNRENKEVPLQFKHQLTQLVLNITGDSDLGDLATLKLAAEGFIPTGSLNLKDGIVTVEGTDAKVLNLTATKADAGVTMRAIVLPGQNMKNTSFVFDLNGMKFKAWIPEDLVLESNARVTYEVELSTDGSVLASPTGTIEDWTDVEGGEVILEPETENDVIIIDDADKELSFDANAAEKIVNVKAPESLAWTASTAETWIT
ncbi:MAG: fimbrillin family protein, partial [Bacteroides sp.]|nr:fimbrillin family protein [Bacteroides sp.]